MKDEKAFEGWINEHVAFKAAEDSRRLTLPANPEAYEVKLPADFTPPPGIEFKFRDGDPLLSQAKTMAHAMGITQENFSKLLGLYAGAQVSQSQEIETGRQAELAKLGATAEPRVRAVNTWLDAKGVPSLKAAMITAQQVTDFEKLMTSIANPGGSPFSGNGRDPSLADKVDDATYEKMTYTERKAYAERHSNGRAV